jgi:hypothetical protein
VKTIFYFRPNEEILSKNIESSFLKIGKILPAIGSCLKCLILQHFNLAITSKALFSRKDTKLFSENISFALNFPSSLFAKVIEIV